MSTLRHFLVQLFAILSELALIARVRARLLAALAVYLAQPAKRYSPARTTDPESLLALLRDGDVLLTEGNTRAAMLIKRLTRSTWSHVSMYVGPLEEGPDPRCIVEADIVEGVRSIRLSELKGLNVRVLRPIGLKDADRSRLAGWVVEQIGGQYDLAHAWALARSLLRMPFKTGLRHAPNAIAENATPLHLLEPARERLCAGGLLHHAAPHGASRRPHRRSPVTSCRAISRARLCSRS